MTESTISLIKETTDMHKSNSLALVVSGETLEEARKHFDEILEKSKKVK